MSGPTSSSLMMAAYRSDKLVSVKRNGCTMLNPYHFHQGPDAADHQHLAVSLLDQIYAIPAEDQAALAKRLGSDNDNAGPYLLWEAFVTGHVLIYEALSSFQTSAGAHGWEQSMDKYKSARRQDVFDSSTDDKPAAIEKWLAEFQGDGTELLFSAAVEGDEEVLSHLILAGHEFHPESDPSIVPLHAACYNSHLGAAKLLLSAGIDVNHRDEFGATPLLRAAAGGNAEIVEWLLQSGADPQVRESREGSYSALDLGARNSNVVRLLLESGVEWSPTALAAAASHGEKESVALIAAKGGLAPLDSESAEVPRNTLSARQREAVLLSIEHCTSKEPATNDIIRWLFRQIAASYKDDVYKLNGSDEELSDALNNCINDSVCNDNVSLARLLMRNLPVDEAASATERSRPPAHDVQAWLVEAASCNALSVARMLLEEFGADSNILVGRQSETPLIVAAQAGHGEMIRLLVSEFNADIHKAGGRFANGPAPLWYAIWSQNEMAARTLLGLGGPVDFLHAAIETGAKQLWLAAEKEDCTVRLLAWMNPGWLEEENEERYLCLEFPDGFECEVRIRHAVQVLAASDGRPVREPDQTA